MDRADALATIQDVAAEVLSVEPTRVTEGARFKEDLDADSLDLVELVMGLEERFDIEVPEDDLEGVTTVGHARRARRCRRPGRRPGAVRGDPRNRDRWPHHARGADHDLRREGRSTRQSVPRPDDDDERNGRNGRDAARLDRSESLYLDGVC